MTASLYLTNALDIWDTALAVEPDFVLSLINPGKQKIVLPPKTYQEHLHIEIDDICTEIPNFRAPSEHDLQKILDFGSRWAGKRDCIVHCEAGVSRSSAAICILLVQLNGGEEDNIAKMLAAAAPRAAPNTRMIEIGDRLLGCDGRLIDAVASIPEPFDQPFNGYVCFPWIWCPQKTSGT